MRRRYILLAVMMGGLIGLGAFTFQYGEGLSYFSTDPAACVNCHIMQPQYDSWLKASHHAVAACVDCHLPHEFAEKWIAKAENGYLHSRAFTFQDFHEPIMIRKRNQEILRENCVACHGDLMYQTLALADPQGEPVNCIHCHRSVGHGETTGMGRLESLETSPLLRGRESSTPTAP